MIMCPFCGHVLPNPLKDGVASCLNCSRLFDSTNFNRLLSAAWLVRKQNICDDERLIAYGFSPVESALIIKLVADMGYSHDELIKALDHLGISKIYQTPIE